MRPIHPFDLIKKHYQACPGNHGLPSTHADPDQEDTTTVNCVLHLLVIGGVEIVCIIEMVIEVGHETSVICV